MFSTVEAIRIDAGIEDNANIEDTTVESYQIEANATIVSAISSRYRLDSVNTLVEETDPGFLLLATIERLISAGMILNKEFPGDETEEESKGNKKIERGDAMLEKIIAWEMRLLFADGTEVAALGSDGVGGNSRIVTDNFECRDFPENPKW